MVRLEMLVAGDPPFETDHDPVDYAAIASAAGFLTRRLVEPGDLDAAPAVVFAHDGPALLDVVTTPDALEVPSHITVAKSKGFALSLSKLALEGGIGELVGMARLTSGISHDHDLDLLERSCPELYNVWLPEEVSLMSDTTLSFERDIKPLFRESDRAAMSKAFDLWSASDVAAHGDAIAARLSDGSMPCDGPWQPERVATFTSWLKGGAKP
jgi:hypothetical protein